MKISSWFIILILFLLGGIRSNESEVEVPVETPIIITTATTTETTMTTTITETTIETTTTTMETTTTTTETTTTIITTETTIATTFDYPEEEETAVIETIDYTEESVEYEDTDELVDNNDACEQSGYVAYFDDVVYYDDDDFRILCNCVENEVGGCSIDSKYFVTSVVINRLLSDDWEGDTIWNVITAPNQFSGVGSYMYEYDYASQETIDCVSYVLNSGIDFAYGATMFYNPYICGYIDWFESHELVAEMEGHRYFR